MIFVENVTHNSSYANSQRSLDAINNTLKMIFGPPSTQSSTKPTKRTVLKRSNGQIMTEKDVIEQMEEKNFFKCNQSRSVNKKTSESKQGKLKETGMIKTS